MKNLFLVLSFLVLLGVGAFFLFNKKDITDFGSSKKPPHYESNVPEHGSTLPIPPLYVVIYFNFDISSKSDIEVTKGGVDYGVGNTGVDSDKRTLRQTFSQEAPDGMYEVDYSVCATDGSCHDGVFKFAIDRSKTSSFVDMRSQKEVTIHLKDLAFNPQNIKVSTGTKITWVNDENTNHTVNTDPHPAHNYYPDQNSEIIEPGQKYTFNFNQKGYYPYHCSLHPNDMSGSIIVE